MENEYISHNFSLFAIFLPIIIKIGGNFEEVLTKTILHSFLRHGVHSERQAGLRSFGIILCSASALYTSLYTAF